MPVNTMKRSLKLTDIQSHCVFHTIGTDYSTTWSEDNHVAVITDNDLQIVEVCPNPHNKSSIIDCKRYLLPIDTKTPTDGVGIDTQKLLMKVEAREAFDLLLNPDLAPNLPKTSGTIKSFKQARWSPQGVLHYRRCLLGCLMNTGQLSMYGIEKNLWVQKVDMSEIWIDYCRPLWSLASYNVKLRCNELKYRVARAKFTAITWTRLLGDKCSCTALLVTASLDGIIALWVIEDEHRESDINVKVKTKATKCGITVRLIRIFESGCPNITAMHWFSVDSDSGLLVIGNLTGVISCLRLKLSPSEDENAPKTEDEEEKEDAAETKKSEQIDPFLSRESLWEKEDLMSVTNIIGWEVGSSSSSTDERACVVCMKGTYMVFSVVSKGDGKTIAQKVYNTKMRFVTGLFKLNDDSLMVSRRKGVINKLSYEITNDANGETAISISEETVQANFVKNRHTVMGIAPSSNCIIFAVVLCVSGPFDHLQVREPGTIVFCLFNDTVVDPLSITTAEMFERIDNIWDCLETARLNILQKAVIYSLPLSTRELLDTMELDQLMVTMWLVNFVAYSYKLEELDLVENVEIKSTSMYELFEEVKVLVFSSQIFKRCALLISSPPESMSDFNSLSLMLIRQWLVHLTSSLNDIHSTTKLTASSFIEEIDRSGIKLPDREDCAICGDEVPCLTGFKFSKCIRGHQLYRCSLSLVQIGSDINYYCIRCNVPAHSSAITDKYATCMFCDGLFMLDPELMDEDEMNSEKQKSDPLPLPPPPPKKERDRKPKKKT